jgi:hypothetical protein
MKIKFHYPLLVIMLSVLFACNNDTATTSEQPSNTKDTVAKPQLADNIKTGELLLNVKCKNDSAYSYAIYLPKAYTANSKLPIIICFDPQGDGKKPLELYKNLAEKYGYILMGSNNSKNGNDWKTSETIAEKLLAEVRVHLHTSTERIYLMGFSGGARIANAITLENGAIAGVICCGAVVPAQSSNIGRSNYTLVTLIGSRDFNYVESKKYCAVELAGHQIKNVVIDFDGKHEWSPESVMDEAFWWMELNNMRKDITKATKDLVKEKYLLQENKIKALIANKDDYQAYLECKKTIGFYNGLAEMNYCYQTYKALQTNAMVDSGLRNEEVIWSKEEIKKQFYIKAIAKENLLWWQKEIAQLNQQVKTNKNKNEALMSARLLEFLSVIMYMQTSGAMQQNQMAEADYFGKLYYLVDPENKEASYLLAAIQADKNNAAAAIALLKGAIKLGFKDGDRLSNDRHFASMNNNAEFQQLLKSLSN